METVQTLFFISHLAGRGAFLCHMVYDLQVYLIYWIKLWLYNPGLRGVNDSRVYQTLHQNMCVAGLYEELFFLWALSLSTLGEKTKTVCCLHWGKKKKLKSHWPLREIHVTSTPWEIRNGNMTFPSCSLTHFFSLWSFLLPSNISSSLTSSAAVCSVISVIFRHFPLSFLRPYDPEIRLGNELLCNIMPHHECHIYCITTPNSTLLLKCIKKPLRRDVLQTDITHTCRFQHA